jgi:hypothetical protein
VSVHIVYPKPPLGNRAFIAPCEARVSFTTLICADLVGAPLVRCRVGFRDGTRGASLSAAGRSGARLDETVLAVLAMYCLPVM